MNCDSNKIIELKQRLYFVFNVRLTKTNKEPLSMPKRIGKIDLLNYITVIYIVCFFISCQHHSKTEGLEFYNVKQKDFINSITVNGYLEASRSITLTCPINGQDVRITDMVKEGSMVHKGDTVCRLQCAELDNQYKDALKNYEIEKSNYDKTQAQQELEYKTLEAQVETIEASVNIAMLDSSKLRFYTPAMQKITKLNLEKSLIQKEKILKKMDFTKRINATVLNTCQLRIQQQDNIAKRAKSQLDKLCLVADTSGVIEYSLLWSTGNKAKIGDVIWGRMPVLKLTDLSELQLKLLVSENQFKVIQKDQKVTFTIDIMPDKIFHGKITTKLPQGKPVMDQSNVKYFEVLAQLDSTLRSIPPGVNVSCKVYLDNIKNAITVPIVSVFDKDSIKLVYLIENQKIRLQTVKTGQSNDKEIIITSGLKPNCKVLLSKPPDKLLQ